MIEYVLGIAIDKHGQALMVRKSKPAWQAGKLNFPGGKVDPGETTIMAMVREWKEETGINTTGDEWRFVATLQGIDCHQPWTMEVFTLTTAGEDDYTTLYGVEADPGEHLAPVFHRALVGDEQCMSNIAMLLGMALDDTVKDYIVSF